MLLSRQMQNILSSAQAHGVQKTSEALNRDSTSLTTLIKRYSDSLPKVRQAVKRVHPQEGEQRADVLQTVLYRRASQTPPRSSYDVSYSPVQNRGLPSYNVGCKIIVNGGRSTFGDLLTFINDETIPFNIPQLALGSGKI